MLRILGASLTVSFNVQFMEFLSETYRDELRIGFDAISSTIKTLMKRTEDEIHEN